MSAERMASELTVAILPLGQISNWQITLTASVLEQEFGVKTVVMKQMEIPPSCLDKENGYCLVDKALLFLALYMPAEAQRIVGVTAVEIFAKEKLYTGRAWLHGGAALYSTAQIKKKWEQDPDPDLMCDIRSVIVTIHEFSHTLGLKHCANTNCIMHESGSLDALCEDCRRWADRELQVKPGSAEERFARAETLQAIRFMAEAVKSYQQAISQTESEPHYYHRLALALAKCGKLEEAKNAQILAIKFAKDCLEFYYLRALNHLEEDPDEAEKLFALAVSAAEDKMHIHKIIGNAYREINHNVDKAIHHYREYFQLGGDDQTIIGWYNSRLRGKEKS